MTTTSTKKSNDGQDSHSHIHINYRDTHKYGGGDDEINGSNSNDYHNVLKEWTPRPCAAIACAPKYICLCHLSRSIYLSIYSSLSSLMYLYTYLSICLPAYSLLWCLSLRVSLWFFRYTDYYFFLCLMYQSAHTSISNLSRE